VIFEILRMGSHDEKGGHFGWIVKSQKGEISKFEPPLFAFSIFSLQKWKDVPVPQREVEAFYSFLIMFVSSSLVRVSWAVRLSRKTKYSYNYASTTNYDRITSRRCQFYCNLSLHKRDFGLC